MITPTIHLNGSSRDTLADCYRDAYSALNAAMYVVIATHPNGRDYYPQGPTATRQAINEHEARVAKIRSVLDDLLALYQAVEKD